MMERRIRAQRIQNKTRGVGDRARDGSGGGHFPRDARDRRPLRRRAAADLRLRGRGDRRRRIAVGNAGRRHCAGRRAKPRCAAASAGLPDRRPLAVPRRAAGPARARGPAAASCARLGEAMTRPDPRSSVLPAGALRAAPAAARPAGHAAVQRWTPTSVASVALVLAAQGLLALAPLFLDASSVDRLTTLFIYGILPLMWNALAGYAGLVSVGHQAFFGQIGRAS